MTKWSNEEKKNSFKYVNDFLDHLRKNAATPEESYLALGGGFVTILKRLGMDDEESLKKFINLLKYCNENER